MVGEEDNHSTIREEGLEGFILFIEEGKKRRRDLFLLRKKKGGNLSLLLMGGESFLSRRGEKKRKDFLKGVTCFLAREGVWGRGYTLRKRGVSLPNRLREKEGDLGRPDSILRKKDILYHFYRKRRGGGQKERISTTNYKSLLLEREGKDAGEDSLHCRKRRENAGTRA